MDYLNHKEPTELKRKAPQKIDLGIMFDLARAVMYLSIAGFIFVNKQIETHLGRSFVVGFAVVCAIYGLFRLWRAAYTVITKRKRTLLYED